MTRYVSHRGRTVIVYDDDGTRRSLDKRTDLFNHSRGFEWGYAGSGPAQLALALLADVVDDDTATELYQEFKKDVVAHLPDEWELLDEEIAEWVRQQTDPDVVDGDQEVAA